MPRPQWGRGNPFSLRKRDGFPRRCAHRLGMTGLKPHFAARPRFIDFPQGSDSGKNAPSRAVTPSMGIRLPSVSTMSLPTVSSLLTRPVILS